MKKIFPFILILLFDIQLFAGSIIKGKIVDFDDQSPLQYVDIVLFKQGSKSLISGTTNDSLGVFAFPSVDDGIYTLRFTLIEYSTLVRIVAVNGQTVNLGAIQLKENVQKLGEVEVVAQTPQVRFEADKKVFNVDENISAAGGSASDILKNIPSVNVDVQGNVSGTGLYIRYKERGLEPRSN